MAGHSLLNQVRTKNEVIIVDDSPYDVVLSYNKVIGIEGYVVGLKFANADGSMDSAVAKPVYGIRVGLAVARRAVQMLMPDLHAISILGFYLLTDDIEAIRPGGSNTKIKLYGNQALKIHRDLREKLQHLTEFEVQGGAAWVISEKPYSSYEQFNLLEAELGKQMRILLC